MCVAKFVRLKGRRHLSLRNDFNGQRLETARIATQSQQIVFWDPDKFSGEPYPPTMPRPRGGGMPSDLTVRY
jgi:hypothetical protein